MADSITTLFSDIVPTAAQRQQQELSRGMLLAENLQTPGFAAALNQPTRSRAIRQAAGGLFGLDTRTPIEREQEENQALFNRVTTEAQQRFPNDKIKQLNYLADQLQNAGKFQEAMKARGLAQEAQSQIVSSQTSQPAAVKEFQFFQTLSPQDQRIYQSLKRQTNSIRDLGNELALVDNTTGQIIQRFPKGISPEQQPALKGAQTEATETAKAQVETIQNAPAQIDRYENIIDTVTRLKEHPGLEIATGGTSLLPVVPGSDAADFVAILNTVQGQVFLNQFDQLKGAGAITEIEGQKAEQALASLDRAQSKEQFLEQLEIVLEVMREGRKKLNEKLQQAQSTESEENVVDWSSLPE